MNLTDNSFDKHRFRDTRTLEFSESTMARKRAPYAPEFRRQMIELVRAGRTPEELAKT